MLEFCIKLLRLSQLIISIFCSSQLDVSLIHNNVFSYETHTFRCVLALRRPKRWSFFNRKPMHSITAFQSGDIWKRRLKRIEMYAFSNENASVDAKLLLRFITLSFSYTGYSPRSHWLVHFLTRGLCNFRELLGWGFCIGSATPQWETFEPSVLRHMSPMNWTNR